MRGGGGLGCRVYKLFTNPVVYDSLSFAVF